MVRLRRLIRTFMCNVFGQCATEYNKDKDPIFHRYMRLDSRVVNLEQEWRPRDVVNLR